MHRPHIGLVLSAAAIADAATFHAPGGVVFYITPSKDHHLSSYWAARASIPTRYAHNRRTSQAKRRRIARMHNPHGCPPRPASRVK